MLKDELSGINELLEELTPNPVGKEKKLPERIDFGAALACRCNAIRCAWRQAVFADLPDRSLVRYFNYHLEGIRQLSDTLWDLPCSFKERHLALNNEFISLINDLKVFFSAYFNDQVIAPKAYQEYCLAAMGNDIQRVKKDMNASTLDLGLKKCLFSYFDLMAMPGKSAFRSLFYLEYIVNELCSLNLAAAGDEANELLTGKLIQLNFNNLAFFVWQRTQIRNKLAGLSPAKKIAMLSAENEHLKFLPRTELAYDVQWPSVTVALSGWLTEELNNAENFKIKENKTDTGFQQGKLLLNLSVAHLACLLRLFVEENLINTTNLISIFKFMSRYYSTKRQEVISPGSLRKEFYTTSQVTAAVVRDILQKMIVRINHSFFPVLAVISAIVGIYPGTH